MNSALQCLNSVPDLIDWILKQKQRGRPKNVLDSYISLVQSMCSGQDTYVNPRDLKDWVASSASIFSGHAQRDAHEFMNSLLNAIQSADSTSFITHLFRIHIQSTVIGNVCEHSDTNEGFTTFLSLPIPRIKSTDSTAIYLQDLIRDFCQEEEMSGDYYCHSCCAYQIACQKTSIVEPLPGALIIQLKRFPFDGTDRKINTFVHYELEYHNLLSNDDHYKLSAVLIHSGSLSGGHYIAITKDRRNNRWYQCNDSYVEELFRENIPMELITSKAYVLIYLKEKDLYHSFETSL